MHSALLVNRHRSVAQLGVKAGAFEPEELTEVIAPRGPMIGLGGGHQSPAIFRVERQRLVDLTDRPPVRSPIHPVSGLRDCFVEIVDVYPVGHEARPPVMGCNLDAVGGFLLIHEIAAPLPTIASSMLDPRSRSKTSAQFRPGSPE